MNLLFIDFETQSVDPENTNVTEVGASMVQVGEGVDPHRTYTFTERLSHLVYEPHYPPQTEEIIEITGITDEMLKRDGIPNDAALSKLSGLIERADYCLAHNKSFDQTVYEATRRRAGLLVSQPKDGWICTLHDVPWPKKYKCKKLSHLAFDHGIVASVEHLHRASYDTDLLATLITTKYRIEDIIAYRNTPWVTIFLNGVQPPWEDGGRTNAQAKKLGFGWQKAPGTDGPEFQKRWVKRVKENHLEEEKARTPAPFKLTRANPVTP